MPWLYLPKSKKTLFSGSLSIPILSRLCAPRQAHPKLKSTEWNEAYETELLFRSKSVHHKTGAPDVANIAAREFDVDARSGFMAPQPPLTRLHEFWEAWEDALELALSRKLKLGSASDLSPAEAAESEEWRQGVRKVSYANGYEFMYLLTCLTRCLFYPLSSQRALKVPYAALIMFSLGLCTTT